MKKPKRAKFKGRAWVGFDVVWDGKGGTTLEPNEIVPEWKGKGALTWSGRYSMTNTTCFLVEIREL